jgi:hypothetical protein
LKDGLFDGVNLAEDLIVPVPHDTKPLRLQPGIALGVGGNALRVMTAVQLNDQLLFKADKVNDIRPYGLLPPELVASKLASADVRPQRALSICWIIS